MDVCSRATGIIPVLGAPASPVRMSGFQTIGADTRHAGSRPQSTEAVQKREGI